MNRVEAQRTIELLRSQGYSTRVIAESTGLSKSCVGRMALGEMTRIDALKVFEEWVHREIVQPHEQRRVTASPQPRQIAAPGPQEYVDAEYRIDEYTEQIDPFSNGRVRVPYPSRALVPYSQPSPQPQPYNGPSRYLQSPRTYHQELQQERAYGYRLLRKGIPRTPQPQPQAETFGTAVGRFFKAFLREATSRD